MRKVAALLVVLTMAMVMGALAGTPISAWAADDADTGKWVVNADGTLSVDEAAAQNAVRSVESNASQVLIGAKGGTITLPSSLAGNPIVKYSNSKDAVTMLYNPGVDKSAVATMLKNVTFSSDTTSVNIAVMDGSTSITVSSDDKTFGVVNIDGTTHMYKYVTGNKTWIGAYADSVTGGYTLGGFKGYLATVTTQAEAELLKGFYDSVSAGSTQGGWIGATSMRYVNNTGTSNYNSVSSSAKVTPNNYENISDINLETITNGYRIKGSKGAYYWTNKTTPADYAPYFYWASGPEAGQQVPTTLWRQNTDGTYGEPNNSSGESATVASYSGTWQFNDFKPNNSNVPGYFLEFSVYDGGLAGNTTYKSTTIYRVTYDKNGATSGTVPDVQAKFENQAMTLATNTGNLAKDASVGFNGWNTQKNGEGTHYDAGGTYPASTNSSVTLYAEWVSNPAKDPTVTGADDLTLDYGYGEADSRSISVSATADAGTAYTLSYQWYSNTTQSNQDGTLIAGATSPTYEVPVGYDLGDRYYYCIVTATRNDNGNKSAVASRCAKVTVQRAPATISFAAPTVSKTYGDAAFTNALTNSGDGAVTYASSNEAVAKVNASTGEVTIVGAGSATITATVADGTHYTYAEKEKTFSLTVEKAAITPTVTMSGYVYGDALPTPATSGNTGGGTVTYYYGTTDSASGGSAWAEVTPTTLGVGTYYMYAEVAETDNYAQATSATASFAVSLATMQVGATGYTGAYDGDGHGIVVTAPEGAAVAYRVEDTGDYDLTENPSFTDVGTYTVYYQVTKANYVTVEGSQTVTISQAQANAVTVSLEGWTYGEAAKAPTSTAAFGASTVEYSYSDAEDGTFSDTVPTEAGTWYVRATVPGTANYVGGQATARFEIAKAAPTPAAVAAGDRTYDGSTRPLATADASTLDGGEMRYALGEGADAAPAEGWSGSIPTATDAGTYHVWCKVVGDINHNDSVPVCVTVTIGQAKKNDVTVSLEGWTYGETAKAPTSTATFGAGTVTYSYGASEDGPYTSAVPTEAGAWYVRATVPGTANYVGGQATASFEIAKAAITPKVAMDGYVFGGALPTPSVSGNTGNGAVTYYWSKADNASGGSAWSEVTPTTLDVGTYYMYAEVAATDNYARATSATTPFAVSPATMQVSAAGYEGTYDGAGHGITVVPPSDATVAYRTSDSGDYNLTENPAFADAGTYAVHYQVTKANYTTVEGSQTVTIGQAALADVSVSQAKELNYTGAPQAAEVSTAATSVAQQPVSFSYGTEEDGTFGASVPSFTDAGKHTVYYRAAAPNHSQASGSFEVTIGQAQENGVDVSIQGWTYGGDPQSPTATATFGADTAAYEYGASEGGPYTSAVPTEAGAWYVRATVPGTANYVGGQATARFEIAKAAPTPAAVAAGDRTYDGSTQALATADASTLDGGEMRYALGEGADAAPAEGWSGSIPTGTDAGAYHVWCKAVGDSNHNDSVPACVTVTIAPRSVTLTSATATKSYDGHPLMADDVVVGGDGFVDGQGASWEVTGSQTLVGTSCNTFTYTLNEGTLEENYVVQMVEGQLTVTSRDPRFEIAPTAKSATFAYDGAEHQVSGFVEEVFEVGGINYTVSGLTAEASATEAGTYAVNVSGTAVVSDPAGNDVTGEFAVVPTAGSLVIEQAQENDVTVSLDGWTYGGDPQSPTTTATFGAGTATYEYSASEDGAFTGAVPTEAGTWYVRATVPGTANYVGGQATAGFEIAKAAPKPAAVAASDRTYDGSTRPLVTADASTLVGGEMRYALGEDADAAPAEGWSGSIPTGTDAGTYHVWYKVVGDNNHNDSEPQCVAATIEKAASSVTRAPEGRVLKYTGGGQALVKAGAAAGGTMQYSVDGRTFSEGVSTATEPGEYVVWYRVAGDRNHTDTEPQSVKATIAKPEPKPEPNPEPNPEPKPETQEMFRLYNSNSGEHLYTANAGERDDLVGAGWDFEGVAWVAPVTSKTPVYRLYSGTDHHFTTSAEERDNLIAAGWVDEGISWYSDDNQGVALLRQFNPYVDPGAPSNNSGSHNYTTSQEEYDLLVSLGWVAEGVGWYGVAV